VSKNEMIDSLKVATQLLDKMDFGNGASCSIVDGNIRVTKKVAGFDVFKLPEDNNMDKPLVEYLDKELSQHVINMIQFLDDNGIHSMGKRHDGVYCFQYKQNVYNFHNDFKKTRTIVFSKDMDKKTNYFNNMVVLDKYKTILLTAPQTYNEPKLPMDKESIMKRTEELMKKRKTEE
jgi:hypothetical protein